MEKYNGWTNYETWVWKLWIDNDQGSQEYWIETATEYLDSCEAEYDWQSDYDAALYALATHLQDQAEEAAEEATGIAGPLSDILSAGLGRIEWREIAASLLDDAAELAA